MGAPRSWRYWGPLELRSKSFEILGVFRGTAQRMKQRLCAEPLKTYCFGSEQATSDFLKDPEGNLAKAQAYSKQASGLGARRSDPLQIWGGSFSWFGSRC
jgi:hypothetical protein